MGHGDGKNSWGAHGQPLPIPDDQVFVTASNFQQPSILQLTAQNWQSSEYTNPPNPSQERVESHINRVILDNYPGRDPEIRAELQDESVSVYHAMEWARMCVNQVKFDIQKYYTQLQSAALGQYYDNSAPPSALTDTSIETALKENFFIAFLYVDSESKQLMFGHPYSDKMFREINQEKLEYFLNKYDYFSRVYTIPLDTHHYMMAMTLITQVEKANFSNDPFYKIFTEKDMPPKNSISIN
ncbi:hypothetical protein H4R35_002191 [Dimargaris xerosporica]|nr:hypothetical protein H4R35_002191 [Dimargaris xerosporica]